MSAPNEFAFFRSSQESDRALFFGDMEGHVDENFLPIEGNLMAHLLVAAEVFPSVSQARKNGWDKPIPKGFSDWPGIGKRKIRITVFDEVPLIDCQ